MSKTAARNLCILAASLGVFVTSIAGGSFEQGQAHANSAQVQSRTQALEVVSITEEDTLYRLTFRNTSNKTINGYSLGVGGSSTLDVDLTIGEKTIPPGGEFRESLPAYKPQAQRVISVLAVFFTDGTSDGDPRVITDNLQRREGTKAQLKRILPLLRAALASPDPPELDALKKRIAALPAAEGDASHHANRGMAGARQDAISALEAGTPDTRKQLADLIADIEQRISRL